MAEQEDKLPVQEWTEDQVSSWLRIIGVKEQYIQRIQEEEVNGKVFLELTEDFLRKEIDMKSGPALLILKKRDSLLMQRSNVKEKPPSSQKIEKGSKNHEQVPKAEDVRKDTTPPEQSGTVLTAKRDCKPRPFDKEGIDSTYVKHNVLQPESGVFDLISPCHEYKSFTIAATLDRTRLQAKFAKEVLKFGSGCMNIRSNGTIHFGVMDSRDDAGYVHGEIIGFPVLEKDMYVDALDYIEKSCSSHSEHMRQCIRPPRFIEVLDMNSAEKKYVVEVDIVPSISIVRKRMYSVRLPNFKESSNKIEYEKETVYKRVGSKTEPVSNQLDFFERVEDRDAQREEAEHSRYLSTPGFCQDLGRKLTMLVTNGKKFIEKEKWYILVTNKFRPDDLRSIDFLLNMNIFCVFDFDPDSKVSGLCSKYIQHHAANMHFMQNYKMQSSMALDQFVSHLHLFEQTSWIFCNGRNDYKGNENSCDEMTWIKTKMTLLRESVSLICKQILPKGTFLVLFLLASPIEKPLLHTFFEFFTDMEGHDDIICISESEENYQKWQSFAESSCGTETVDRFSVVGMKMSHIDATLQQIQPITTRATKHLPIFVKGQCLLETREEERMYSLEIISTDHCNETTVDFIESKKDSIEGEFYHGGRVTWLNFWLAENGYVGEVIQRDAYKDISQILNDTLKWRVELCPVYSINIYHHPGSGGSTVARQILWNNRKDLRCAIVKPSYSVAIVTEHAVQLREYEEKDEQKCLPVLLLIEDCDKEYLDDLRNELENAMNTKKIKQGQCFILLSCRRSHNPEKMCKDFPLNNVSVTHKLSPGEKIKFAGKLQKLEKQYNVGFILTFVLMSEEFKPEKIAKYVENFVKHLLEDIDRHHVVTRLIRYVALLNTYVQNSFLSQSHWEATMALPLRMNRFRQHTFEESLSDPAKLVLVHLKDDKTHIESIRIIHPLVAKEILQQLLGDKKLQSCLAKDLLEEDVLFEHRFGREDYVKFLRALFMRRCRISKGDEYDSFFSPLIEHVCAKETPATAIELLTQAYQRFNKDAFFAQQLARLNYTHDKFEEARHWAEIAAKQMPNNSYILDTKGQVYRRWFIAKCKIIEKVAKTAENTADAVETALRAIDCFKECENAAISDREDMNNSGFFATVEVGCSLLKLIFSLQIFSNKAQGHSECMKYLLTGYIPEELRKPWEPFHCQLKKLQMTLHASLEWISEDLSYFQTDIDADESETIESLEITRHPLKWLVKKSTEYGKYFCEASIYTALKQCESNPAMLTPFMKRLIIYRLGGGNLTTIFSIMTDPKEKHPEMVLENIISLYPNNPQRARLEQMDLVNYIAVHIALSCMSTPSPKVAALKDLQTLSQQFPTERRKCLSSALFLLTLLFWPEDDDTDKENKFDIVQSAVECLKKSYWSKMKDVPTRKRRIYTHFFLSNGSGWNKIVHKSKVEAITKILSVSEKRMKWFRGEAWKMPEIACLLKTVSGWTEDGVIYLNGPKQKKFCILPLNIASVPHGNENVTFYLGFTFRGPVAYNITVKE